jgi:hypothetical protein
MHSTARGAVVQFCVKCLLYHPDAGQDPQFSIPALFNFLVDNLTKHDNAILPERCMLDLCENSLWAALHLENQAKARDVRHHLFLAAVFMKMPALATKLLEDLSVPDIESELFTEGPLQVAIESDQYDILRRLLDRGADVNGPSGLKWVGSALEKAACNSLKYVELILSPQYGYKTTGYLFEMAIVRALDAGHEDSARFILTHSPIPVFEMETLLQRGLAAACRGGSLEFVQLLTENIGEDRPIDNEGYSKPWRGKHFWRARTDFQRDGLDLVTQTAWKGHEDILRYLLLKGASPCGEFTPVDPMRAIAWDGHLHIGDILVDAGLRLTEKEWTSVFYVVYMRPQPFNFAAWVFQRGLFDMSKALQDPKVLERLMGYILSASAVGHKDFVITLAENGFPITDTSLFETGDDTFPTAYARATGQTETLQALLDLGVPDRDPLDTPPLRDMLLSGKLSLAKIFVPKCRMPSFTY